MDDEYIPHERRFKHLYAIADELFDGADDWSDEPRLGVLLRVMSLLDVLDQRSIFKLPDQDVEIVISCGFDHREITINGKRAVKIKRGGRIYRGKDREEKVED